jgi:hypothetical protein
MLAAVRHIQDGRRPGAEWISMNERASPLSGFDGDWSQPPDAAAADVGGA